MLVVTSIVLLTLLATPAAAAERSTAQVLVFKRANPCPATGQRRGACPGHVVDHVEPLCAGGRDHPSNMQWQPSAESLRKDAEERRLCRKLKTLQN
jgi:hypothetical protein